MKDGSTPEQKFFKKIGDKTINMYTAVRDYVPEEKKLIEGIQNLKWVKYTIDEVYNLAQFFSAIIFLLNKNKFKN